MNMPDRYWSTKWNCTAIKISPGEYQVTSEPVVLTTILGSCIAACIHDPVTHTGGMNHFMLPHQSHTDDQNRPLRYGLFAMETLINEMMKQGSQRNNLVLKICGGGDMMQGKTDIGEQNINFIQDFITRDRLPLEASDLGGSQPRRVAFFPTTGRLFISKLDQQTDNRLLQQERYLQAQAEQQLTTCDITLFDRED